MPNEPRFKKLRPYKDPISARDWNRLTETVVSLSRSFGVAGIFDSSGLHIRGTTRKHSPPYYKIQSNDGGAKYTLHPQIWKEATKEFVDRENAGDVTGYEVSGNASGDANDIVKVYTEVCIEGEWIGLFEINAGCSWGVAYETTPWSPTQYDGKYVKLHPCDDEKGANEDTSTVIKAYVFTPVYDKNGADASLAPDGLEVYQNDVLAYVSICNDDGGNAQGILLNPPLRLPPEGYKYQVLAKLDAETVDYVYGWDWPRWKVGAS